MDKKIRVLIVDDSVIVRQVLSEIFRATDDIEVVDTAVDPIDAREKIKLHKPDVLTLDIEMPKMDGITFLANLMRLRPMPVVMVSTLTEKGADATFRALELGAVDFVSKPKVEVQSQLRRYSDEICSKVRAAAKARVQEHRKDAPVATPVAPKPGVVRRNPKQLIAIGSSTGGTEAVKEVLTRLPADSPPVVITQHIPKAFSAAFAARMDACCPQLKVLEATHQQELMPGHVYIAPGDRHLLVMKKGSQYFGFLNDGPDVNHHKPSVDVMFRSLLDHGGKNMLVVLLTGMGSDGAYGMLELKQAGAHTIAQDQATSVVWGMPGAAVNLDAQCDILPLLKIPGRLIDLYQ